MNPYVIHSQIHEFMQYLNSCIYRTDIPTHLVFELELTPMPFLMELFIDSTGDVVMASNDIEWFSATKMLDRSLFLS